MELLHFDSFDAYEEAVVNVDLKVRLLGPHDGSWRIGHADADGITVQQGVETVANLCEAAGWPSQLMFLISAGSPGPTWLNGVPFGPGRIGVLAPGRGFVFRAIGANAWVTIALPLSSPLFSCDDRIGSLLRRWCLATQMVDVAPVRIEALRSAALTAADSRTPRAAGRRLLEHAISALAAASCEPARPVRGRPAPSPHELCDAALGMLRRIDARRQASVELEKFPLGARSLRGFFSKCFGISPMQYLHLRQLHAVRSMLRGVDGSDIPIPMAFEMAGYPYSSYSLAHYRALFGELPTETRAT
ncbi:helix-turn-helix domain-containing protein [Bordetella bronchiseptica]